LTNTLRIRRFTPESGHWVSLFVGVVTLTLCLLLRAAGGVAVEIDFETLQAQAESRFGDEARSRVAAWQHLLEILPELDELERIHRVNAFFHQQLRYRLDSELHEREDYWATPLESLGHGAGDCEDYVIAKYVSLRHAGIDDARLKLVYVRARIGGPRSPITQAHMVLSYQHKDSAPPLILDSLIEDVLPASLRTDLLPVFSFNRQGIWAQGAPTPLGSATARLSQWRNVLERMESEGVRF
jgi:predicted transglutaminase-like cysteine proteinase